MYKIMRREGKYHAIGCRVERMKFFEKRAQGGGIRDP